jgi:hypothetical protein
MKSFLSFLLVALIIISSNTVALAAAQEITSTMNDQESVAVTIYNDNLALIKDKRTVKLNTGFNKLAFSDVSAQIRPETAILRSLTNSNGFFIIEQNFDFDLLTPQKLLEKYIGQTVRVATTNYKTGEEKIEEATVLAANNGVVLKIGDRIETGLPGRIIYNKVPANLRERPTLVLQLNSGTSDTQKVELSYLSGGLSWKADYVAELSPNDDKLDLSGWVTLTNMSGATYNNAKLQLVAGDVNRVKEEFASGMMYKDKAMPMAEAAPKMNEEGLFEYHLYTLDRPTTIAENQTKQVALLSATNIPVTKELLFQGNNYYYGSSYGDLGQKMKVGVYVEFQNKEASKLGMPIPKGIVRVYKNDKSGNAQFIGEDSIDHTPKNEKIRLKLGDAFDVTADKKQTDFKSTGKSGKYYYVYESAYEIVIKNAKSEAVTVKVQEPIPGDWIILDESHKHTKATSNTAVWEIKIPAEGKTTLTYRVQVRY